jgi:hypothetical protein
MVLKRTFLVLIGAALFAASGAAVADEYRPGEFLGLDLSKAVLSPKPLGPPTQFAPVAVEAKSDTKSDTRSDKGGDVHRASEPDWARSALRTEPKKVAVENVKGTHPHHIKQVAQAKPKGAARVQLARRHGNPLDAQAMDTRIQTWPCRSGGICNWK